MSRGVIIAAPASGSGKTVVTLGLVRHLTNKGLAVATAKVGPDYIDPAFHAAAGGRTCINLDPWGMRGETLTRAMACLAVDADIVICEGVMGLFDGATVRFGSTADLAAHLGWPVVLVVDVSAQAASAAAVVGGFARHRPDVTVAAVIFNRVGSDRHAELVREACHQAVPEVAVGGCLPRTPGLSLPERHLGLVQAREHPALEDFVQRAAELVASHVDVPALMALAAPVAEPKSRASLDSARPVPPLGQRIAVADDLAFAFSYPLVIDGWRAAGAEIVPFSPLADEAPDAAADAIYLPGGYPELHAGRLAANHRFRAAVYHAAARGAVVWGECGGYMVLGRGLVDADGHRHRMLDLLDLETSFAERRLHLGYRRAVLEADTVLGPAGTAYRGHEFHYARTVTEGPGQALFNCSGAAEQELGPTGLVQGLVMGSFVHLIDREAV
ncbi:MAG: cobyrinate a,c-diamide synthase [Rhodospirillales bacterium]|nr:MAG: cobyrinate a,c-diamide synthase [Rhodospirillales bacterium]